MINKLRRIFLLCLLAIMVQTTWAQDEVLSTFNAQNVILPSSQYTPEQPYQATVWIHDTGKAYEEQYYNQILAVPEADAEGRQWFENGYELNNTTHEWTVETAPFSSDEVYKGQQSCRWVATGNMGEIYMRRTFRLDAPITGNVFMTVGHDDAPAEWYINGVLVHSSADGWNNDEYILLTDEQKALIKTDGQENLLAVHVHQNWGGAFADCGLYLADMAVVRNFLPTVASGAWECKYYYLNYNSDITVAERAKWYAVEEDESDWISGVGPFSNDQNMFYTTEWASQMRPILIRRHFTLTAADIEELENLDVYFSCSYDEDPKVYLNGTRIWGATGWNDNEYADVKLTGVQKKKLREGDNVLAVSLVQGGGGGHIDYGLRMIKDIPASIGTPAFSDAQSADNKVYNLNGQCLGMTAENLGKGIYIIGGRKFVKE